MRPELGFDNVLVEVAMDFTRMTAAGAGDNTEVTGETIDIQGARSATLVLCGTATLADTETISVTNIDLQESDDGTTWDADVNLLTTNQVVATGGSGGTTEKWEAHLDVDLFKAASRKRYIRFNITYDLSASGTDVAQAGAVVVKSGLLVKPDSSKVVLTA